MQLALSCTIGFGTPIDNNQATFLLNRYSLEHAGLRSRVELIKTNIAKPSSESGLFLMLQREGHIKYIDFLQYYREKRLLERAENTYKQEIQSIKLVFGETHLLYKVLKSTLAHIISDQGRWEEAEELELHVLEISKRTLGPEHPDTLASMASLAGTYSDQGKWSKAETLQLQSI